MATTITPQNAARVIRKYGGKIPEPISSIDWGLVMGLYGPGGIGKTTTAATITDTPLGSPALLLNASGNPEVISSYSDRIDVIQIGKFSEQEAIRADIEKDAECPYKSVILDNVTDMFHLDLRDRYGADAKVDWQQHSATTSDLLQLCRNWKRLAEGRHKLNVIMVFQETPEARTIMGQKVDSRSEIAFNKALQFQIPTIITFLGRLYIVETSAPYTRKLDFRPIETLHQGKIQIDPKDEYKKTIPMEIWNPSLAPVLEAWRGVTPFPVEAHQSRTQRRTG